MADVSNNTERATQVLGRKTKPRTTYARYHRKERRPHVYDFFDGPLSPQRRSQPPRRETSITKCPGPRLTGDEHTTPSSSQKSLAESSLAATPHFRRPLPGSADWRKSPRSITSRTPVEPTRDPALQSFAASLNDILTKSDNKLPRKSTASWQKTREAAKAETPMQAEPLPPTTNHIATEVSSEAVSNKYIRAAGAVRNLNPGHSDGIEMAKVNSESGSVRVKSQSQTEDNDEYFNVEAITGCKLGARVCCFEVVHTYSDYGFL
jgi:hypothetical protein